MALTYHQQYYLNNKHKIDKEKRNESVRKWRDSKPEHRILAAAKSRAKRLGMSFDLEIEDINIPEYCPILLTKLARVQNVQADSTPALDRIDNSIGYTKGNVRVISHKANRHKANLSIEEIERLYLYSKKEI